MKRLGALLVLLAAGLSAQAPRIDVIHLDNIIFPITAEFVQEGLRTAADRNDAAVLIELNTPGGLDSAMREMITAILASRVPVIVWVGPGGSRAASAGFLILLSADVASMALGTNTGAAHPVFMSGKEMDPVMKQKVENDASAYLRSFATARGRSPDLAVKGIIDSRSFSEAEALDAKMIDLVASTPEELIQKLDGRTIRRFHGEQVTLHLAGAHLEPFEPSSRQSFLFRIIEPNIALVLAAVGILGIFFEFNHPGMVVPGVVGAIALILGLYAFTILPISLTGALLIVLALSLFVLEAKVASHGILAVGGVAALILGALILIDSPIPEMRVRLSTAIAIALPLGLITVFLLRLAIAARKSKVMTGVAGLLGNLGEVHTDFEPQGAGYAGQIFVQGEIWRADSSVPVARGARVRVQSVEGLRLHVDPV